MHAALRAAVVGLILLSSGRVASAGEFEGVIHMTVQHRENVPVAMQWMIKGHQGRMEVTPAEGASRVMIMDAQTHTMMMLVPERKTVMELKLNAQSREAVTRTVEDTEVERTGKSDKVAGYPCERWLIKEKGSKHAKHQVCVGKGFGDAARFWMDPDEMQQGTQPSWMRQLLEQGGFALRSVSFDKAGTAMSRMEVVRVERKKLEAGLFAVPADWTRQDLSAMQSQMNAIRERMKAGHGQGQSGSPGAEPGAGPDVQQMIQEMQKRRAERGGSAADPSQPSPDLNEAVKKLEEMLKRKGSAQ